MMMAIPFFSSSSYLAVCDAFTFRRVFQVYSTVVRSNYLSFLCCLQRERNFGSTDIPHHPHAAAIKLRKKERERESKADTLGGYTSLEKKKRIRRGKKGENHTQHIHTTRIHTNVLLLYSQIGKKGVLLLHKKKEDLCLYIANVLTFGHCTVHTTPVIC